jgi:membrane protease YdiL (CAAX protease family)
MSELPPPTSSWPPRIAWTIIWLGVAYISLSQFSPKIRGRHAPSADVNDIQLTASAKYAVGSHQLSPTTPIAPFLKAVDDAAQSPKQKMDAAILAGDLQDAAAAEKRLNAIDAKKLAPDLQQDLSDLQTIYAHGPSSLDQPARDRLIQRHAFFGQLALAFGQPKTDPQRQSITQQGVHTAIVLLSFAGIALCAGFAGLILLIVAIVLLSVGSIRPAYQPPQRAGSVFVEMFAVYLLSFFVISLLLSLLAHGDPPLAWYWIASIVLPIAFAWGIFRGATWNQLRMALGWHGGRNPLIELPLGIVGYITGLPIIVAGFCVTLFLVNLSHTTPSHPIQGEATNTPASILQLYGIACLWAPIIEETMFRGALFSHLRRRWNWLASASLVGFIFAAIHPQGWTFIPVLGSIGVVLAGIREWRGSILPCMVAHALNNFVMVSLLLAVK